MPDKYIGEKKVSNIVETGEKTSGGIPIVVVYYEDGNKESFSSLMLDVIVSEESCDLTALREKRLHAVVEKILDVLRDWGVRVNELGYMGTLINQSLAYNQGEALKKLWKAWGAELLDPDDVTMITIDNVLRAQTLDETITEKPDK